MGKFTAGLIAVFYPVIVVLAVVLLAAVQMRSSGGALYDTWRLNYRASNVLGPELDKRYELLRAQHISILDGVNDAELCLKLYDADGKLKSGIDQEVLDDAKAARKAGKDPTTFKGDLRCLLKGFIVLHYDRLYYSALKDDLEKKIADLQKKIAVNNEQYGDLIKGHQEFLAFDEMEKNGPWYFKFIAIVPYNLMVLLLVMSMGALGGMVRLLRDYGDPNRQNPALRDYFLIPLIGLVVAIGGYVLAKTGLLLLSSTKEETSLNPFMIGLVGIVSGLLAKDVIDAIARAGANMVKNQKAADSPEVGSGGKDTGRAVNAKVPAVDEKHVDAQQAGDKPAPTPAPILAVVSKAGGETIGVDKK